MSIIPAFAQHDSTDFTDPARRTHEIGKLTHMHACSQQDTVLVRCAWFGLTAARMEQAVGCFDDGAWASTHTRREKCSYGGCQVQAGSNLSWERVLPQKQNGISAVESSEVDWTGEILKNASNILSALGLNANRNGSRAIHSSMPSRIVNVNAKLARLFKTAQNNSPNPRAII